MESKFVDANFIPYTPNKWLTFDDVLLLPQFSDIPSRKDESINVSTKITSGWNMATPIISANMDTVTEAHMAITMHQLGGLGILHRFYDSKDKWLDDVKTVFNKTGVVAISIGLANGDIDLIEELLKNNINRIIVCVDVAHGHMESVYHHIRKIALGFSQDNVQIIAGNVATPAGAQMLVSAGVHAIKCGIGGGSVCSTRIVTGHGVPQLSAIMNIRRAIYSMQSNVALIADGGIRESGDICKALAAGADSVMIGKLFAATDESPGDVFYRSEQEYLKCEDVGDWYRPLYKQYRGQSSRNFMDDINKHGVAPEGVSMFIPTRGSVVPIFHDLMMGLKSGMTYSGVRNIKDLFNKTRFIEISNAGYVEGTPHGLYR